MTLIASAMDVREQVLESAMASLGEAEERAIALVLVDAIDDRGFLSLDVEEIATETGTEPGDVEKVLRTIQEIAPPGVGARSLQESLLLQVDYLRAEGVDVPDIVTAVIEDHLEELGSQAHRAHRASARRRSGGGRSRAGVHSRSAHPTPTAIAAIDHLDRAVQRRSRRARRRRDPGGRPALDRSAERHLRPAAHRGVLPGDCQTGRRRQERARCHRPASMDQETVSHAKAQVARAQQFIWAVRQRKQTLLRVAEYVCAYQEAYIRGDARGLRPLTRSEVANALGVHESTCSRAVAGKFIMLPSRKVIPMSDLFAASLSIKHVIQQIISEECATGGTLSDAQISERLLDHGIRIARRTVAKYRSQMHILPSTIR